MMIAVVQSKMTSRRLPEKALCLIGKKPSILHVLERVTKAKGVDGAILATGRSVSNLPLINEVEKYGFECFVGNDDFLLDRYYECAKRYKLQHIIRICGDCPLVDSKIIEQLIELYNQSNVDYASNLFPSTYPYGMNAEILSFCALERARKQAKTDNNKMNMLNFKTNNFKSVN